MAKPATAHACGLIGHAIGDSERSREPRCEKWMAGIGPVAWRMASEWDGAPGSSGAAVPRGKRTAAWQPGRRFYAKPAVPARTPGRIVQGEGCGWSGRGVRGDGGKVAEGPAALPPATHVPRHRPAAGASSFTSRQGVAQQATRGGLRFRTAGPIGELRPGRLYRPAALWTSACLLARAPDGKASPTFRASVRRCQSAGASPPKALATLAGPSCCPLVRSKGGGGRPWRSPGDMSTRGWHGGPSRDLSAALSLPSFRKGTHSKRFE